MEEAAVIKAELADADRDSYTKNIFKSIGFLSLSEQMIYYRLKPDFLNPENYLDGGYEDADRAVAMFLPDYMDLSLARRETIAAVSVRPLNRKFSEELNHRDYLGALMNLGIERSCIGDIMIDHKEGTGCIFCLKSISEVVISELTRIRHTSVNCFIMEEGAEIPAPALEELKVNVASERTDAVIAAVFNISRQKAAALIDNEKVFISGREGVSQSKALKEGDRVSVRGMGKFIYSGVSGSSRKGRLFVNVSKFV